MNPEFSLKMIRDRAVDQIARNLESAISFLSKYETLSLENISVLDDRYPDLEKFYQCFRTALHETDVLAHAYKMLFNGSAYDAEFATIYFHVFDLKYKPRVFQAIDYFKSEINHVAANIRTGTLEMPTSDIKEVA